MQVNGTYGVATVLRPDIADDALRSVINLLNHKAMREQRVVVMPDVHYAGPCPVGFTCTYSPENGVIPAIIGGDVGCGLLQIRYPNITELLQTDEKSRLFQCI